MDLKFYKSKYFETLKVKLNYFANFIMTIRFVINFSTRLTLLRRHLYFDPLLVQIPSQELKTKYFQKISLRVLPPVSISRRYFRGISIPDDNDIDVKSSRNIRTSSPCISLFAKRAPRPQGAERESAARTTAFCSGERWKLVDRD